MTKDEFVSWADARGEEQHMLRVEGKVASVSVNGPDGSYLEMEVHGHSVLDFALHLSKSLLPGSYIAVCPGSLSLMSQEEADESDDVWGWTQELVVTQFALATVTEMLDKRATSVAHVNVPKTVTNRGLN